MRSLAIFLLVGLFLITACRGPAAEQGPPGPQGSQGIQGLQGERGPQGEPGGGSPSTESAQMSINGHLDMIDTLFNSSWPTARNGRNVPDAFPADSFYNSHQPLETEWGGSNTNSLRVRIKIGELDLVRSKVVDWRTRYARWVEEADEQLGQLSESNPHFDMVQAAHSRGLRILAHVDELLSK